MSSSESVHHLLDNNKIIKPIALRRSSLATGLPSPNSSFSSLSSFASNPSSRHTPRTPLTPLRSTVLPPTSPITPKARPSPLFRLLHSPSPIPPPTMTLHQPTPHYSQPPSPTNSSTSPNRPPSRSERLLRDTLRKDEVDRNTPSVPSPLVSAHHIVSPSISSPSQNAHRRRHSHVPQSSSGTTAHDQQLREREEYTRGSFLFRSAMTSARPPSPSPSVASGSHHHHQQYHSVVYGGDVEAPVPFTPQRSHHQNAATPGMPSRRGISPVSNPRSEYSSSRKPSQSPSPMRRRPGSQHRPSPLLLDPTASPTTASESQRRQSLQGCPNQYQQAQQESPSRRPRSQREPPTPPSRGEPMVMTPHEQVLRARLERVLNAGKVLERKGHDREPGRRARGRSDSSQSNEVRDEDGGWPWRRTERDIDAAAGLRSLESVLSSPMESSNSNSSSQSFRRDDALPSSRPRSKTDAVLLTVSDAPSRQRSITAPSAVVTPHKGAMRRTSTTPPLVPDASPILGPTTTSPVDMEDADGELRLLTPPPTPPFTFIGYNGLSRGPNGLEGYCPSPYKTADTFNVSRKRPGPLGAVRRPTMAPRGRYTSPSLERSPAELDEHDETSSCSSQSYQHSSISSTFAANHPDATIPHSPEGDPSSFGHHHHHMSRPQFNARKASVQCRAMEGYVSFASVEGLGVPPDDPRGEATGEDMDRGRKTSGVLAWGVGGFRKFLGGVVGANENTQHHHKESVVL